MRSYDVSVGDAKQLGLTNVTVQQENINVLGQSQQQNIYPQRNHVGIPNVATFTAGLTSEPPQTELPNALAVESENIDSSVLNKSIIDALTNALQAVTNVNPQQKDKFSTFNVVPEFDPKVKNQTIVTWLNKVTECAEIYGWDSKQTAHYALPKLTGTAKRWYEGQASVKHTWDVWQEKLKSAFPIYENYGRLLSEMLETKAKFGDDLEEYYYEKLIVLNRCGIVGKHAIDCIVHGIEDRSVRYGAEAVGFEDTDKLLGYLKNVKHERVDKNSKKIVRPTNETFRKLQKHESGKPIRCFNCHEIGHVVINCKKPLINCQKCKRTGHDDPNCSREVWKGISEVKKL